MKKMILGLIASMVLLPVSSFAQAAPQAPASWIAFEKQENAKQNAFFKELKSDRDAFLSANPDAKEYLNELRAAAKVRFAAQKAARQNKINSPFPPATP